MKRITVDLEDDFHRRLKMHCAEKGLVITELIRELLSKEMEKSGKKSKSKSISI